MVKKNKFQPYMQSLYVPIHHSKFIACEDVLGNKTVSVQYIMYLNLLYLSVLHLVVVL